MPNCSSTPLAGKSSIWRWYTVFPIEHKDCSIVMLVFGECKYVSSVAVRTPWPQVIWTERTGPGKPVKLSESQLDGVGSGCSMSCCKLYIYNYCRKDCIRIFFWSYMKRLVEIKTISFGWWFGMCCWPSCKNQKKTSFYSQPCVKFSRFKPESVVWKTALQHSHP